MAATFFAAGAVTVLSLVYLLPGLLAVLLVRSPQRASTWIALGAPVAVGIQIVIEFAFKGFMIPPRFLATLLVILALFVAAAGLRRSVPWKTASDWRAILATFVVPIVFVLAFPSAILRPDLTSDGVEALEMALRLDSHFLPRWPSESGLKGFGQGLIALAFPNAWFASFGSERDFNLPRATFLMFLGVIAAQVLALVEVRREAGASRLVAAAIAISVLAAGATLGLHVSFDPYFADPSNPSGAELMTVAMMLGAFVALVEQRTGIFLVAAVLAHATLPSGLLFVVTLAAAWFLVTRSRRVLWKAGAAALLCVLVTLLYEKVYVPRALPAGMAMDAGSESLGGRMRLLIFTDFARFAFLIIPCGIVPFFFLFAWKKQDALSCVATLVTAVLFLFFFVLATYSPHYFAPAMVLALVPYWRFARSPRAGWIGLAGAVLGLALSLPPWHEPPKVLDAAAHAISLDWVADEHGQRDLRQAAGVLQSLAYLPWEDVDPEKHLVASGLQLAHASAATEDGAPVPPWERDWVVMPDSAVPEKGYLPVVSRGGWSLFARPGVTIESIRDRGFHTDFQAPWYRVPRAALFRVFTEREHRYDLDLRALFGRSK